MYTAHLYIFYTISVYLTMLPCRYRQLVAEDNAASTRNNQRGAVLCWGRDSGTTPASFTGTVGALPEVTVRLSGG